MAKHAQKPALRPRAGTDWKMIGAIVGVGVLALVGLLAWASSTKSTFMLDQYCRDKPENCITQGLTMATTTVYELYDYGCPACQSFALNTEPQIQTELISAGSVRYVYLPVALWPETLDAAQGAYCAVEQQAFAKWHKNMYETMTEGHSVALERMQSVAQSVGMDVAAFTACVQSGRYRAIPSENSSVAKLESTPTFFIGEKPLVGALDFLSFQRAVNFAIASSKNKQ
jgi:protein-disulfide isomerase